MKPVSYCSVNSSKRNDSTDFGGITLILHNHGSFEKQMAEQVCRTFDYFASSHRNVCNLSNFLQGGLFDSKLCNFWVYSWRCVGFHIDTREYLTRAPSPKNEDFMKFFQNVMSPATALPLN